MVRFACWVVCGSVLLAACGGGGGGGFVAPVGGEVTSFSGFLFARIPSAFVVEGEGFGAAGSVAQVRFTATDGDTPFETFTSPVAVVDVEVVSSTRAIGFSPVGGPSDFAATIELLRPGGVVLEAPGVLAFFAPTVTILIGPDDETLVGGVGPDVLDGGTGFDRLFGGPGNDDLFGGTSDDGLWGEADDDTLTGGSGKDGFYVAPGTDQDTITDYQAGLDRLFLEGTPDGLLAFAAFAGVTDAGPAADVTVQWSAGGTLVFQGDGDGTIDDVAELILSGVSIHLVP